MQNKIASFIFVLAASFFGLFFSVKAACTPSWTTWTASSFTQEGLGSTLGNVCGPSGSGSSVSGYYNTSVMERICSGPLSCSGTETCDDGNGNLTQVWHTAYQTQQSPAWGNANTHTSGIFGVCYQSDHCDPNAGILENVNGTLVLRPDECLNSYDFALAQHNCNVVQTNNSFANGTEISPFTGYRSYPDNTADIYYLRTLTLGGGQANTCPYASYTPSRIPVPGVCFPRCNTSVCGNGVVDSGETCDTGISYGTQACGNGMCAGGTQTKTCNSSCSGFNYGSCSTAGTVCASGDQCNDPGYCGSNGNCNSSSPKTNGTACNDGNACTSPDTCTTGICSGSNICSGVVNGSCGTANKTYASSATTFGSDTFCATGTATSFNPNSSFPASGSAITWVCQGSGGGASPTCSASRASASVNDPSGTDSSSGACERASTWWSRNGAAAYNLYRNTVNNSGTATKILSNIAYTDPSFGGYIDTVAAGTYYYWVQNVGSANLIASAQNTRVPPGLTVPACPCTFSISPSANNFGSAGGSGTVTVTASYCAWTATPNVAWLHVTSGTPGNGPGTVVYTVDSYTGPGVRSGTITIAGQTFTVTQDPPAIGDPYGVDGSSGACERASTFWFRNGAAAYNLYRNTSNNSGTATKILSNVAYTDPTYGGYIDTVTAGTYYYWVQNVGSPNLIGSAQNTRFPPGLIVPACPCTFSINPTSRTFTSAGGSDNVLITASGPSCIWNSNVNNSWLNIISSTSGIGNGSITYTAASYPGPGQRTGTMTIAGQTYTVTQDPPIVNGSCGSASRTYPYADTTFGSDNFCDTGTPINFNPNSNFPAAGSSISWICGGSGGGSDSGTCTATRQAAPSCNYSLSPTFNNFPPAGGSSTFTVSTGAACSWTASPNNSWLHIVAGANGMATGTVAYTVDAYAGATVRTGTITAGGQTFTVTQDPPTPCSYSINPTSKNFSDTGGTGSVAVTTTAGCAWTAVSNASAWLHVTGGTPGNGSGTVNYSVDAYSGVTIRSGTMTIAGQTFTVTQDPPTGGGPTSCSGMQGFLQRDYWNGIAGTAVSNLTSNAAYPNSPTGSTQPNSFESPSNIGDNYGQRMYGLVKAPSTGSYTFYIASDDDSQLWISTDATPANKLASPIASVLGGWNNSREWTKYSSQTSAPITLTAGQTYYIEALMKEGSGGDVLAVGWKVPGSSTIDVVPGSCLSPYASASPPGGPQAGSVHVYNSATDPSNGRTACQRVTVIWTDNSTDETGFKIFKDGSLLTTRPASSPASQTGTVMSYTFDPGDLSPHNYAVAATNAIGDSSSVNATENPTSANVCGANLGSSDKNIVALNGNNLYSGLPYGSQCDSVTDALPANTALKLGDKLKFSINLCNTGQGSASTISVTDTLINLIKPSSLSDFNAYWGATKLTYDGNQAPGYTAQANHYFTYNTTAVPNQTIKFILSGSVAAGTSPALTFEAQTSVPATFTGAIARLQNGFNVSYNNGSIQTALPSARYTPLVQFYVGSQVPTIREIP